MTTKKQDKTRIIQIWGDILDQGFTSVPNILLRYRTSLGIKSHHLALIIDIMSFKWDTENPYPSYSALAEKAGVTVRGIMKTIQDLERLKLLTRTQRFDKETGAQITTIFDFRPLVQRLTEEMQQATTKQATIVKDVVEIQTRGGEPGIRGGMNYSSGGGMNYSSPKEYTYNNKTHINKKTLKVQKIENHRTANKERNHILRENERKGVRKYFRNGIFRKRLFEIYDNLHDVKHTDELVEEAAYKACNEVIINRVVQLSNNNIKIDPYQIASQVKQEFPYEKIPEYNDETRKFFVATICNLTAEKISSLVKNR